MSKFEAVPTDSKRLLQAREYAAKIHEGQIYKPDLPYTVHLNAVENAMRHFGIRAEFDGGSNGYISEDLLIACQLHDTMEDTTRPKEEVKGEISQTFGASVAEIVELVTDKPGANRKERHRNTYPALAKNPLAVKVKLADRIANLTRCHEEGPGAGKLSMYQKEHEYFYETLYTAGESEDMWAEYLSLVGIEPDVPRSINKSPRQW